MTKNAHIIPHSHWDREWRYPLWENRSFLVDFMDELLETLNENPDYRQFLMDGQSVILEDYLLMRPEKRDLVEKYVKEGRITAGPWYTLPDLYPIDGECLIRNLMKGYRVSAKLGKTMKVAYTSFGWGQISQFPQIYLGFGIDFCFTAKRVTSKRAPKCEFWWASPDGSKILTTRLGEGGRHKMFESVLVQMRCGRTTDDNWHMKWEEAGLIYHKANPDEITEYHRFSKPGFFEIGLKENLQDCWAANDESMSETERLFLCGCDFSGANSDFAKVIEEGNKLVDYNLKMSTVEEYIEAFKKTADIQNAVTVDGELREGPSAACSGNALATRLYLKQMNKKLQNLLIYTAEPLGASMLSAGEEYDSTFFEHAWEYTLKSHPHDSINGVTQDSTANDVVGRLNQALSLTDVAYRRAMMKLIRRMDLSGYNDSDLLVAVYNPLPFARNEIIKVLIDVPKENNIWELKITDNDGNEMKNQRVSIEDISVPVHDQNLRPAPFRADRHVVYMETGTLPAGGFKIYKIETKTPLIGRNFVCSPQLQKVLTGNEISKVSGVLENEYLKVSVNTNGTVRIEEKESGRVYDNMHFFEDTGEAGSYWINQEPDNNRVYYSTAQGAKVWTENNGELSATLGIEVKMELPECAERPEDYRIAKTKRSDTEKVLKIRSFITLKKGEKKVDVKVEIDNNIKDHRLRAVYPTGIKADYSYAHGHFTVDKRPIVKTADGAYEPDMQTLPMQTFVDIADEKAGVAFINNSLTEFEAKEDGSVFLTLLRSVRNTICTEMRVGSCYPDQEGGQCIGMQYAEYSIYPHSGNWEEAAVFEQAEKFNITPCAVQISGCSKGDIAPGTSFFEVENKKLVISAFKKAEDRNSIIMRLYNPTDNEVISKINLYATPKKCYVTNLNEERISEFDINAPVKIAKQKIATFEFEF